MADPGEYRGQGKSIVVPVRLSQEVYDRLKANHPEGVSAYLRKRITYDTMRKHGSKKKKKKG